MGNRRIGQTPLPYPRVPAFGENTLHRQTDLEISTRSRFPTCAKAMVQSERALVCAVWVEMGASHLAATLMRRPLSMPDKGGCQRRLDVQRIGEQKRTIKGQKHMPTMATNARFPPLENSPKTTGDSDTFHKTVCKVQASKTALCGRYRDTPVFYGSPLAPRSPFDAAGNYGRHPP